MLVGVGEPVAGGIWTSSGRSLVRPASARSPTSPNSYVYDPQSLPYLPTLTRASTAISGPRGQRYLRVFSRLHDTAGVPHWPGFRRAATTDWLAPLEQGMASLGRPN